MTPDQRKEMERLSRNHECGCIGYCCREESFQVGYEKAMEKVAELERELFNREETELAGMVHVRNQLSESNEENLKLWASNTSLLAEVATLRAALEKIKEAKIRSGHVCNYSIIAEQALSQSPSEALSAVREAKALIAGMHECGCDEESKFTCDHCHVLASLKKYFP